MSSPASSAYPPKLVEELERLTRERHRPPKETPSVNQSRQARIDEIVAELKSFPSPKRGGVLANTTLMRIIGKGNFGVVWQGVHVETGDSRAVKVFDTDRLGLGLTLYHFRRGVRAMVHLAHQSNRPESIIEIHDIEESGLAFAMDFIEGHDLSNLCHRGCV